MRMERLRAELKELDRMESALGYGLSPLDGGVVDPREVAAIAPPAPYAQKPSKRRHIEGGIKGAVMSVLVATHPLGLTAQEILKALNDKRGIDLPRTSLSPQLSRLKRDNEVDVAEGVWTATTKGLSSYLLS